MSQAKAVTDNTFQQEVLQSQTAVVVDFWAEWCGPCKMLAPVLDRIAAANSGKITVVKMNVDENPDTPQQYGVQGIPTLIFFKGGEQVQQLVGFQSEEKIQTVIDEVVNG